MGQKTTINLLPSELREKVMNMLCDPSLTQRYIVEAINEEAGRMVLSTSSLCRFSVKQRKESQLRAAQNPSLCSSLKRIADALERIAKTAEQHT